MVVIGGFFFCLVIFRGCCVLYIKIRWNENFLFKEVINININLVVYIIFVLVRLG